MRNVKALLALSLSCGTVVPDLAADFWIDFEDIALDDVMFNAATPVPEPATMALAGIGLAAAARRRRASRVRSG